MNKIPHDSVVVAIGDITLRKHLYQKLIEQSERLATICHPRSIVSRNADIGQGSQIIAGAVINTGTRIGHNTIINTGSTIDHHNVIGDHVHIAPGAHLGGEVVIKDEVLIGIGSTIAPRCKIGKGCIIGAGSVVLNDIPDGVIAYGSPAQPRFEAEGGSQKK